MRFQNSATVSGAGFLVDGKDAGWSGPRQREAYMFDEGRALL